MTTTIDPLRDAADLLGIPPLPTHPTTAEGNPYVLALKKLTVGRYDDSLPFSADVYVNGKKCFHARDDGNGGCVMCQPFTVQDRPLYEAVCEHYNTIHAGFPGAGLQIELKVIVTHTEEQKEIERQQRTWCKTKIVFRLPGDDTQKDGWRTYEGKYNAISRKFVLDRHPDAEILNERYNPIAGGKN